MDTYPDQYRLRDVLLNLHNIFDILANPPEEEKGFSLSKRALLAADRWRIMCKHVLMIKKSKTKVDSRILEEVLAHIEWDAGAIRADTADEGDVETPPPDDQPVQPTKADTALAWHDMPVQYIEDGTVECHGRRDSGSDICPEIG